MAQKTIVFDFGGVIFRTSAAEFYREHFASKGYSEQDLEYFLTHVLTKSDRSKSNGGDYQTLIDRKIQEFPSWADEIRASGVKADFLQTIRNVIPGMEQLLDELTAQGFRIVGLTNWHGDTYDALGKAYPGILKHFNNVVVSGRIHLRKPDPEIFRHAQMAYGSPDPEDVYYFDDKPDNVSSASRTVGWKAFVFKSADTVREALALNPSPF